MPEAPSRVPSPPPMASFLRASVRSRSSFLRSSSSKTMRAGMSSSGTLSSAAAALAVCTCLSVALRASRPVSASRRRTPAATPESVTPLIKPISPVRLTWVPPHSSIDQPSVLPLPSPIATTRTSSPYFSPNSARAGDAGVVERHQPRGHRGILQHEVVGDVFHALDFLRRQRLGMREVEAQPVGRHQRAFLRHVIAEHLAQRLVQQMGGGMVLPYGGAPRVIDFHEQRIAHFHRSLVHLDHMYEKVAGLFLGVGDGEMQALASHLALVANLAATLAVERRLVHHQRAAVAFFELGYFPAVAHQRGDHAFGALGPVSYTHLAADE